MYVPNTDGTVGLFFICFHYVLLVTKLILSHILLLVSRIRQEINYCFVWHLYERFCCWGCIFFLSLSGKASRKNQKWRGPDENIRANLRQYGLEKYYLDALVSDSSRPVWRKGMLFDAIITDRKFVNAFCCPITMTKILLPRYMHMYIDLMSQWMLRSAVSILQKMTFEFNTVETGSAFWHLCIYFKDSYKCVTKLQIMLSSMETILWLTVKINMAENHPLKVSHSVKV